MQRRALLKRTTALLAAGSAAGCIAGGAGGAPESDETTTDRTTTPDPTETPDATTTEPPTTTTAEDRHAAEPFETWSIGSREGVLDPKNNKAHAVSVVNATDEKREMNVHVRRSGENPVLEPKSFEFPAHGKLRVELLTPGPYAVDVHLDGEKAGSVAVERSRFDCNSSRTEVTVGADGSVESQTVSTMMGCPPHSVQNHDFEVTDRGCKSGDTSETAEVSFEQAAVELTGTIEASTPQRGARLARAEYDVDAESFVVVVETTEPEQSGDGGGEMGVQCVGALDYEARIEFANEVPAEIEIRHRSGDETHLVTTAGHGSSSASGGN